MEYVMIAVKKDTKKWLDELKTEYEAPTYDELVRELAGKSIFKGLSKHRGILKGCAPFVRDKRDRVFS
ncbi:MAG: hypothetical protein V1722_02930 [Candidatus Micrarchaeota archaeon]